MKRILTVFLCCVVLCGALPPAHGAEDGEAVRIAFLDSGISQKHLDASHIAEGENLIFPERDTDDNIGHGTATAGIVLGSSELGLPGVCSEAVVVPLVCYDTYASGVRLSGGAETLARAIYAAVDQYDCRVLNISMGTTEDNAALRAAVAYALARGIVIVSAVGNSNSSAPENVYYPAAYDGVIGVGAADGEQAAAFSQRHGVDVLAPGVSVETVTNKNAARTQKRSGTSYACAYVSGICAALLLRTPTLSGDEVCQALFSSAKDLGTPGYDADTGWGLVGDWSLKLPDDPPYGFLDVEAGSYYEEAVRWASGQSIVDGVSSLYFAPDDPCTRAQMVTLLWRTAGCPEAKSVSSFCDVDAGSYYADAVAWAVASGITEGTDDTTFSPEATCTRAQAVTFLYRASGSPPVSGSVGFSDVTTNAYYANAVRWAEDESVTEGIGGGRFGSDNDCTRAQIVTFLWRAMAG